MSLSRTRSVYVRMSMRLCACMHMNVLLSGAVIWLVCVKHCVVTNVVNSREWWEKLVFFHSWFDKSWLRIIVRCFWLHSIHSMVFRITCSLIEFGSYFCSMEFLISNTNQNKRHRNGKKNSDTSVFHWPMIQNVLDATKGRGAVLLNPLTSLLFRFSEFYIFFQNSSIYHYAPKSIVKWISTERFKILFGRT